jgi:4-hydroxy-2-oxoheptanedioate aldolase
MHAEVVKAATDGIRRIRAAGKAAGILAGEAQAAMYMEAGASMVCLGSELGLLVKTADALAARWTGQQHKQV